MKNYWYVQEKLSGGRWKPVLYYGDRPSNKTAEGRLRNFRDEPRKVPHSLSDAPMDVVSAFMAPDGEFSSVQEGDILAVLEQVI